MRIPLLLAALLLPACGGAGEAPPLEPPSGAPAGPTAQSVSLGGEPLRDGLNRLWADGTAEALSLDLEGGEDVVLRLALLPLSAATRTPSAEVQVGAAEPRRLTASKEGGFVTVALPAATQRVVLSPGLGAGLAHAELLRPEAQPRRVVVVVVDTLRADHLGLYGYSRPTSPELDAIGAGGAWWTWTLAPAPWTLPSTRAIVSGRPHAEFEDGPVLMERFAEAGWATAAITRNPWLSEANGFAEGAGVFDAVGEARAAASTARALDWLRGATRDRSGMLFLHHMDPHLPYDAPGPLPGDLAASDLGRPELRAERQEQVAAYDAEIRYTDASLGELWRGLQQLPGESLLVVTSDHGEELWEHGGMEHGHTLHAELLRVPLVVAGDRVPARAAQEAPASLLDVAPTVLAWAGLDHPDLPGRDLLADELAPFPPMLLGETVRGGGAWGLAAVDEAGSLGRYWVQVATEHLYGADDPLDRRNLAEAGDGATAWWRGRLEETFGVEVSSGIALHVSRGALNSFGELDELILRSPVAITSARSARADEYDDRRTAAVELIDAHAVSLRFGEEESGGLVARTEGAPPEAVVIEAEGERTRREPRAPRPISLPLASGRLSMKLQAGPVAWPTSRTPRPTAGVSAGGAHAELEALGYIDP